MSGRVASSKQSNSSPQPWPGRGHVVTFVRCLHLLDLNLLEDWPGVTEQLFTAKVAQQNLQQRVKAVEWSLYRLFELYDPAESKDKLRPFFPPTTQLQSLNLRAALYRCLTELKKSGILGKDVLLRKTMLDDCKGERFEEAISNFAMITLRKTTTLPEGLKGKSIADVHTVPVIIAIRLSLQRNLNMRKEEDANIRQDLEQLAMADTIIQQRLEASKSASVKLDRAKQDQVHGLVNSNWIGSTTWSSILLQGIPVDGVVDMESSSKRSNSLSKSQELIQDLDTRIGKHRTRLAEWKVIAKDLTTKQKLLADSRSLPEVRNEVESPRFVKHKELNLSDNKAAMTTELPMDESYASLLASMRQDFRTKPATTKDVSQDSSAAYLPIKPTADSHPVPKTTMTPTPPGQQGSIVEQSSPINRSAASEIDGESIIPDVYKQRPTSLSPPQSSLGDSPWVPNLYSSATVTEDSQNTHVRIPTPPNATVPEQPISPSKLWMSLADRTRVSMSLTDRASILTDPDSPVSNDTQQPKDSSSQDWHQSSDDDRHATLVERTRKSMSMFSSSSAVRQRKTNSQKRSSQAFPINQFETPGRPQPPAEQTPGSGASTPRDQLFDEEAEYTSIFKSRPKIALSPTFGSERRPSGLGSILEHDMELLKLDSDDNID